jgi:hypothetical protein
MEQPPSGNGPLKTTVAEAASHKGSGINLETLGALLAASEDKQPKPSTAEPRLATPPAAAAHHPQEPALSQHEDTPPTEPDAGPEAEVDQQTDETDAPEPDETPAEPADEPLPAEVQARIDKRIGKEVKRRKEAEAKATESNTALEALHAQIAEMEARPEPEPRIVLPAEIDPLRAHPELKSLREQEQKHQATIDQLIQVRRDLARDPEGTLETLVRAGAVPSSMDAERLQEEIETVVANSRTDLASARAERNGSEKVLRRALVQQEQQFQQLAKAEFPWFGNKADPRNAIAQQFIAERPYLRADPLWPMLAAGAAQLLHQGQQGKPAAKAAAASAPRQPVRQPSVRPTSAPASQRIDSDQAAYQAFRENPGSKDATMRMAAVFARQK